MTKYDIFTEVLNHSVTASYVILAVIAVRFLLKRAPKIFSYLLWSAVLFRLLCPITIAAPFAIISNSEIFRADEVISERSHDISFFGATKAAVALAGDVANGGIGIQHVYTTTNDPQGHREVLSTTWEDVILLFGSNVWVIGMFFLAGTSMVHFILLRKKLIGAVPLKREVMMACNHSLELNIKARNIYLADHIEVPFVIGILRPKIYLPSSLKEEELEYVILHEQHHINRGDHIWKLFAFILLCIHCFNPLVWLSFVLYTKDMEMSCDEAIMRKMNEDIRQKYSMSLLKFSVDKKVLFGMPLAFGESDTKARIKNVMHYKKPVLWGCVAAVVLLTVACAVLVTHPEQKEKKLFASVYGVDKMIYNVYKTQYSKGDFYTLVPEFHKSMKFQISEYGLAMEMNNAQGEKTWNCFGDLEPIELTKEELEEYMPEKGAKVSTYYMTDIKEAYISKVRAMNGNFELKDMIYLVLQTSSGDTLLGMGWQEKNANGEIVYTLDWLNRMEIIMEEDSADANFFDNLLEHALDKNVSTCSYFETEYDPGYLIVGFISEDELRYHFAKSWNEKEPTTEHDVGFAVFQINHEGNGYKLIDCHLFEDAVSDDGQKVFCAGTAVADADGIITDKSAYDVIFCIDDRIEYVLRVLDDGTEIKTEVDAMTLLHWEEQKLSKSVKTYFLDEDGNILENISY